ncbi:sensor domain-containing diguanylate cyclase [Domibacillus mangrovi]|uniref:GGDEF domain-containing protein n=1 Tax=Domibacillus mangrovi TaxID=1714354 RepID=A0A1Q5P5U7_9BACI|nr:diguanylate cyclase [Domibacillus mangrovi]OKL37521.1 hypothetical protein BLL40_04220 [Domibacillus mangrovi]
MSLQKKISVFFLLAMAVIVIALYIVSHIFVLNSFTTLENNRDSEEMKRVLVAIDKMETQLVNRLNEYADSNFIRNAVIEKNTDASSFFNNNTFLTKQFTSVLLMNKNSDVIFQKRVNFKTGISKNSAPGLLSFIQTEPSLTVAGPFSGMYVVNGDVLIIALTPVKSNEGDLIGTMMIGRHFDPPTIRNLRSETRLPIFFESPMDIAIPKKASDPDAWIMNSPTWIKRNSESIHTIYAALYDYKNKPGAIVGFEAPRDIYLQGRQTMFLWGIFTIAITAILAITGLYLLNTIIFKRLNFFVKTVADIRAKNDLSLRLPVKGHDEISKLEREFNRLLSSVEQSRSQIVKLAYEDSLTRLPNRAYFFKEASIKLNANEELGASAAIMFMDLDGFKQVNDQYGHEAGDKLLKHVANVLLEILRTTDIVSRLGGDEFILFLPNVHTHEEVSQVAKRIREAINVPIDLDGQIAYVSSSIGISFYPDHGTDLNTLISYADEAMFIAKERGKNQYSFYKEPAAME